MKIIIFSDSHGDIDGMYHVIKREEPGSIIHLGDHIKDADDLHSCFPGLGFYAIAGNTDYGSAGLLEQFIEVEGHKIFITHGHEYNVKAGLLEIMRKGALLYADIVLFGHTHKAHLTKVNGMWLINPGTAKQKKASGGGYNATYASLELKKNMVECEIVRID